MTTPHRHRTARERAAHASAQAAIARAHAHTQPPPPPDPEPTPYPDGYDPLNWPPTGRQWRARCRQIAEQARSDRERARNA